MTPKPIIEQHHATILRNNDRFVHWLSPMDEPELRDLLSKADYAHQLLNGEAILIGYDAHSDYRHKNVEWICERLPSAFYIDRIIIGEAAQGRGVGRILYEDVIRYASKNGFETIACEVNTEPDNPGSHAFHGAMGFEVIGEERYSIDKAVLYYALSLHY